MQKEALLYKKTENNSVLCFLCSHRCSVSEGEAGFCRVRRNIKGVLHTMVYGEAAAANIDPIEKKPLYHFLPGSKAFSLGTVGCNFHCGFCQNWQISQAEAGESFGRVLPPGEAVAAAADNGCAAIAYTYNEPTVFFEYARDIASLARDRGIRGVFVTNGYMTGRALEEMRPFLDAANVDLKSFRESFYEKNCRARLKPVLDNIARMKKMGIWIEVTTLVVPGENDSPGELSDIAGYISSVGVEIPWHISRFHSDYKFKGIEDTPLETLEEAAEAGEKAGLRYVYLGNTAGRHDTRCFKCGQVVIKRGIFSAADVKLKDGKCPDCKTPIDGIWE